MAKAVYGYTLKELAPVPIVQFTNTDGTSIKDICTAGADDSRIYEITVHNAVATAYDMTFYLNDGAVDVPIKLAAIAANQGNVIATPDPLRLINTNSGFIANRILDRDQNYYISIKAGWKLRAKMNSTITAGGANIISVLVTKGDF